MPVWLLLLLLLVAVHLRVVTVVMWFLIRFSSLYFFHLFICERNAWCSQWCSDFSVRKRIFSLIGSWMCLTNAFVYLLFWLRSVYAVAFESNGVARKRVNEPANEKKKRKIIVFNTDHVWFYWFVWHQSDHQRQHEYWTTSIANCAMLGKHSQFAMRKGNGHSIAILQKKVCASRHFIQFAHFFLLYHSISLVSQCKCTFNCGAGHGERERDWRALLHTHSSSQRTDA